MDDELNPVKALGLWPEAELAAPEPLRLEVELGLEAPPCPAARRPRREPRPDSPHSLAVYFREQIMLATNTISGSNIDALRAQFAGWLRQGVRPAEIRSMINAFCKDPRRRPQPGVALWRAFLHSREELLHHVRSTGLAVDWDSPEAIARQRESMDRFLAAMGAAGDAVS